MQPKDLIPTGIIYTLGTSTRELEEFLDILSYYGIEAVVDVRRFPKSRFPHFGMDRFRMELEARGLDYHYMGRELGGFRPEGYESYTKSDNFRRGLKALSGLACTKLLCLVCAERLPWRCHRRWIGRGLEEMGWFVVHILEKGRLWGFHPVPYAGPQIVLYPGQ